MKQINSVTNAATFNSAADLEYYEIVMIKKGETFIDSMFITTWGLCCVRKCDGIETNRGEIQFEEDQALSPSCADKASRYMDIVHEAIGIEPHEPETIYEMNILDDKILTVRWVVGNRIRHINS